MLAGCGACLLVNVAAACRCFAWAGQVVEAFVSGVHLHQHLNSVLGGFSGDAECPSCTTVCIMRHALASRERNCVGGQYRYMRAHN